MSDDLRERLIVRILRMHPGLLPDAERLLTNLECGNVFPLSADQRSPSGSPAEHGVFSTSERLAARASASIERPWYVYRHGRHVRTRNTGSAERIA